MLDSRNVRILWYQTLFYDPLVTPITLRLVIYWAVHCWYSLLPGQNKDYFLFLSVIVHIYVSLRPQIHFGMHDIHRQWWWLPNHLICVCLCLPDSHMKWVTDTVAVPYTRTSEAGDVSLAVRRLGRDVSPNSRLKWSKSGVFPILE